MLTFLSAQVSQALSEVHVNSQDLLGFCYSVASKLKPGSGLTVQSYLQSLTVVACATNEYTPVYYHYGQQWYFSVSSWLSKYECRVLMNNIFGCHNSSFLPIHLFSCDVVKLTAAGNKEHSCLFQFCFFFWNSTCPINLLHFKMRSFTCPELLVSELNSWARNCLSPYENCMPLALSKVFGVTLFIISVARTHKRRSYRTFC